MELEFNCHKNNPENSALTFKEKEKIVEIKKNKKEDPNEGNNIVNNNLRQNKEENKKFDESVNSNKTHKSEKKIYRKVVREENNITTTIKLKVSWLKIGFGPVLMLLGTAILSLLFLFPSVTLPILDNLLQISAVVVKIVVPIVAFFAVVGVVLVAKELRVSVINYFKNKNYNISQMNEKSYYNNSSDILANDEGNNQNKDTLIK